MKARSKKSAVNTPILVSAVRPLMQAFVAQKIKAGVWTAPRGVAGRGNTLTHSLITAHLSANEGHSFGPVWILLELNIANGVQKNALFERVHAF